MGWTRFTNLDAVAKSLPKSLFSIVAEKDGELVGATRVSGDGAMYFYIMDVAVMPELQGRGIGTALMNAAVEFIAGSGAEHALTFLFTGASGQLLQPAKAVWIRRPGDMALWDVGQTA